MYVFSHHRRESSANYGQVAYLMADISDVNTVTIKDLYERLESLPCEKPSLSLKGHTRRF
jgi:D-3-phosphoglycerate dehydrogenase